MPPIPRDHEDISDSAWNLPSAQVSTNSRKGMFDAMSTGFCADEQVAAGAGVSKRGLGMSAVPVPTSVSPKENETTKPGSSSLGDWMRA